MNFSEELLKNKDHLKYYALSLTVDEQAAKDLTQDTLLKALKNKSSYVDKKSLRSWLFTIMKNTFINQYRRDIYRRRILSEAPENRLQPDGKRSNESGMDLFVMRSDIYKALTTLDLKYRIPFVLFYKGYKYKEISDRLSLPLGTVKSRIYFARKLLMTELNGLL